MAACLTMASSCGALGQKSACDGLVYSESGPTRSAYLPCAGEILNSMDGLRSDLEAGLQGDARALARARAALAAVERLMRLAGGRKLLERWDDRALTDLNVDISNAFHQYQAVLAPLGLAPMNDQIRQTVRQARAGSLRSGNESADSARRTWRRLR